MSLVLGIWTCTIAVIWIDVRQELSELLDGHLAQAAALLVVQGARPMEIDEKSADLPTLHRYANRVAFQVFHGGRLALRSANAPTVPMVEPNKNLRSGFETVQIDNTAWRVFAAYSPQTDTQVYVGERVKSRTTIIWAAIRSALWPMVLAMPLLALAAWWAAYRGSAPLRRLGRILVERQPRALDPVSLDDAPSEMTPMLESLNGLFARIGELMESERRFTADASHELRTPVAGIRAQVQVALDYAVDAKQIHALQGALAGCDRATRLVEQLLTLSRLESGLAPALATVDMGVVIRSVVADLAQGAFEKEQSIAVESVDSCFVRGDEILLAVLVRNLVDNAIRYCPPKATVNVHLATSAGRAQLNIEDSGPAMSERDIKRFGERFFRVIGNAESGSGLGWSIVRRIVTVHGAEIQVKRSSLLGGLSMQVEWPAQGA